MDDVSPVMVIEGCEGLDASQALGLHRVVNSLYSFMWAVQLLSMSSVSIDSAAGLSAKPCVDAIVVLCGTVEFG